MSSDGVRPLEGAPIKIVALVLVIVAALAALIAFIVRSQAPTSTSNGPVQQMRAGVRGRRR